MQIEESMNGKRLLDGVTRIIMLDDASVASEADDWFEAYYVDDGNEEEDDDKVRAPPMEGAKEHQQQQQQQQQNQDIPPLSTISLQDVGRDDYRKQLFLNGPLPIAKTADPVFVSVPKMEPKAWVEHVWENVLGCPADDDTTVNSSENGSITTSKSWKDSLRLLFGSSMKHNDVPVVVGGQGRQAPSAKAKKFNSKGTNKRVLPWQSTRSKQIVAVTIGKNQPEKHRV